MSARALYSLITGILPVWDDDSVCSNNISKEGKSGRNNEGKSSKAYSLKDKKTTANQAYSLWPNPNNGNMTIVQNIANSNPVKIEILNSEGQRIYQNDIIFNGSYNINVPDILPGLYIIHLRELNGSEFLIKFIVKN